MKHRSVIIVGNAKSPSGDSCMQYSCGKLLSAAIDSFDVVIRFNDISNSDQPWIGSRTDILFVRSQGWPAYNWSQLGSLGIPKSLTPGYVLFSHDEKSIALLPENEQCPEVDIHRRMVFNAELLDIEGIKGLAYGVIPFESLNSLVQILAAFGDDPIPSIGTMAIHYCIESPQFKDCRICIIGFGFRGWPGHPWKAEESYVGMLISSRQVSYFPFNAFS